MFLQIHNRTWKKRKLYFNVLLSFIIMAFLIVLSTSMIFYFMYINNIYKQLGLDSTNSVKTLTAEFDNSFKEFKYIDLYLIQLPDINTFLYSSSLDDYYVVNRADMISGQICNLSSFLHSIILYNKDSGMSLMSGKLNLDKSQFINGGLDKPDTASSFNMVFSTLSSAVLDRNDTVRTISILFNDSERKDIKEDSSIVLTIDREELQKKLLRNIQGQTIAVDNSGSVIFTSDETGINGSILHEPYFSRIVHSGNPQDSFEFNINNEKKIISYARSSQTGFYIINFLPTNNYIEIIRQSTITIISISLVILLIFLAAGYFLSNRIYKPIKKVTELFSDSKFGETGSASEEISTISRVFNNAMTHINELEAKSQDNNNKLKEEFLRRLLRGTASEEAILEEHNNYSFNVNFTNLIHICIRIDNFMQIEWSRRFAYESALWSAIPEILDRDFACEPVNMYDGEIALLLNFRNTSENDFTLLVNAMDKLRQIISSTLSITITIGLGGAANSVEECSGAYGKAVDMVKNRFTLGHNNTIHPKLLENVLATNTNYPDEMAGKLIKAIRLNKKDDYVNILDDIIELLKQYHYSKATSMLFQIITESIKAINQTAPLDNSKYYLGLDDISNIFDTLETLDQAKAWLINIFNAYQEMLENISQLKNHKHYKLVEKMQDYIRQQYHDSNINVESLADIAGYTPYYFSKIFRDITGLNVIDYIRQVRITKAKELLSREDIRVGDIPMMIGLTNTSNFYATFKKDVGLTPSAYREYILSTTPSQI